MRKGNVIILGREDMSNVSVNKDILDISFDDFIISFEPMINVELVLFIDTNGHSRIIKNRYGDNGQSVILKSISNIENRVKDEIKNIILKLL